MTLDPTRKLRLRRRLRKLHSDLFHERTDRVRARRLLRQYHDTQAELRDEKETE